MLIEKEELNKLSPSYQKIIVKLETKYSAASDFPKKWKLLIEFSQNYLMLPKLWEEYFTVLWKGVKYSKNPNASKLGRTRARNHFCIYNMSFGDGHGFKKLWHESPDLHFKLVNSEKVKNQLSLPQKNTEKTLMFLNEYSSSPITKEGFLMCKKSEKLYDEIFAAENDTQKWFELISQVEDTEYVCNNAEYRIGNNMNNVQFWKIYINYLKKNDTKRLLYVYSCYCRFFLDDMLIKEEYKNTCKIYGPSFVPWKNLFDFEKFEEEIIDEEIFENDMMIELAEMHPKALLPLICKPKMYNFEKISVSNYVNQNFPFHKTLMFYIIQNINSYILQKLHKCCKYFFVILPYPVCHNLSISEIFQDRKMNHIEFYEQSAEMAWNRSLPKEQIFGREIIISNTFHCAHNSKTILSEIIPNIFQCDAKYIRIFSQHFTFNEFKFLVEHGNVELLHFHSVKLVNEKNEKVEFQEILQLTPKIIELRMSSSMKTSQQTFEILADLNFVNKFRFFWLHSFTYIEPYGFSKFLKNNLDSKSTVLIDYKDKSNPSITKDTVEIIKNEIKNYWTADEGPYIKLNDFQSGRRPN